jgi:hypothetical protein
VVPLCSDRIARAPPYSSLQLRITSTGLSPSVAQLSSWFLLSQLKRWPDPRSLATTSGVSVDVLSSGYLDVSVPRVCFLTPMYSGLDTLMMITGNPKPESRDCSETFRPRSSSYRRWVSPFGNLRVKGCSHLTVAYRSVPRPSSPLTAKASTRCS